MVKMGARCDDAPLRDRGSGLAVPGWARRLGGHAARIRHKDPQEAADSARPYYDPRFGHNFNARELACSHGNDC